MLVDDYPIFTEEKLEKYWGQILPRFDHYFGTKAFLIRSGLNPEGTIPVFAYV